MNKTILAFGASNSKHSINKQFAKFVAEQIPGAIVDLLDLNDFEMPIYSIDREKATGVPDLARQFLEHIEEADGIVISFAEHNWTYTVAYKNIYDWTSRIQRNVWMDKPMYILSTSPGGRGGKTVHEEALASIRRRNKNVVAGFSLPSFRKNFSEEHGILDAALATDFNRQLQTFIEAL